MKKSIKKILSSILITTVTLITGFLITAVSFSLYDKLSINQMRLLFAFDIICILIIGMAAWFIYETKKSREKKRRTFEYKHRKRVADNESFDEILNTIKSTNFAA